MTRCMLAVVLGAAFLTVRPAQAGGPYKLEYKVVKSFSTLIDRSNSDPLAWDVNSPDGLAWDGSGIWVSGCDGMTFAKFDTDGRVVDRFKLGGMLMADHLAWDGTHLWANLHSMAGDPGPPDGRLLRIDVKTHKIVKTIDVPFRDAATMTPMGMGFDGKYLWTNDPQNQRIYRIDPATGEGKDTPYFDKLEINGNVVRPCGVSYDGHGCLWISDLSLGAFIQVDPKSKQVVSFLVPPDNPDPSKYGKFRPDSVRKLFTGMTTDGKRVWVVDEMEGNPLIYQLDVKFPTTGACAHPVALGAACKPGGQPFCASDAVCWADGGAAARCVKKCSRASNTSCPAGSTCWTKGSVDVCLPSASGVGSLGAACTSDGDCQSGACGLAAGSAGTCTERCVDGQAGACPSGQTCQSSLCVPTPTAPADGDSSSGCHVAPSSRGAASLLVLLAALILLVWGRRRFAR